MSQSTFGLAGKIVLVNGGATGIGRATAEAFAREGARITVSDIAAKAGAMLEARLREAGLDVAFVLADATDEAQVAGLVEGIVAKHGRLDIAINNVGNIPAPDRPTALVHETSLEAWDATMTLCLRSAFLCMKHEIAAMLRQGGGAIANTASLAGIRVSEKGSPAYHAAKAAIVHLSRKAAVDYAARGIRVNVVAPGVTATEHLLSRWSPEQLREMVEGIQPMNRAVTPEEIASAFLWLCSDHAGAVTGLTVPVDGGWAAR